MSEKKLLGYQLDMFGGRAVPVHYETRKAVKSAYVRGIGKGLSMALETIREFRGKTVKGSEVFRVLEQFIREVMP